jgi:hypothetical protein
MGKPRDTEEVQMLIEDKAPLKRVPHCDPNFGNAR